MFRVAVRLTSRPLRPPFLSSATPPFGGGALAAIGDDRIGLALILKDCGHLKSAQAWTLKDFSLFVAVLKLLIHLLCIGSGRSAYQRCMAAVLRYCIRTKVLYPYLKLLTRRCRQNILAKGAMTSRIYRDLRSTACDCLCLWSHRDLRGTSTVGRTP